MLCIMVEKWLKDPLSACWELTLTHASTYFALLFSRLALAVGFFLLILDDLTRSFKRFRDGQSKFNNFPVHSLAIHISFENSASHGDTFICCMNSQFS